MYKKYQQKRVFLASALIASASVIVVLMLFLSRTKHMVNVDVNCSVILGKSVSLLGVNNGPLGPRGWDSSVYPYDLADYYMRMGVNFIRIHDLWGSADIDIVFPDFSRSPDDENAYNFSSTDKHISMMLRTGTRVIFRLGYSWSDPPKNSPPKDYDKWAEICLHIVKHYTEGWAGGMVRSVKYWEIWNEPDIEQFWNGTLEEYFLLYEMTARKIKDFDPSILVGGPALAYDLKFLEEFLSRCREFGTPLDFVSWHVYSKNPYDVYQRALAVRRLMERYGFSDRLSFLTEWNIWKEDSDPYEIFRGPIGSSFCASCLIYLQNASVDIANFYRGDSWPWGGLFYDDGSAGKAYYVMAALSEVLRDSNRVQCTTHGGGNEILAMATVKENLSFIFVVVSNYGRRVFSCQLRISGIPWYQRDSSYELLSVDEKTSLETISSGSASGDRLEISLEINPYAVYILKLKPVQTTQ
ncbi:MAG: hypothetical protein QXF26_07345 [Candidatus Bathyarchaeia archaeon]